GRAHAPVQAFVAAVRAVRADVSKEASTSGRGRTGLEVPAPGLLPGSARDAEREAGEQSAGCASEDCHSETILLQWLAQACRRTVSPISPKDPIMAQPPTHQPTSALHCRHTA